MARYILGLRSPIIHFLMLIIVAGGCSKSSSPPDIGDPPDEPRGKHIEPPTVTQTTLVSVSTTKAVVKANLEANGGASIKERGICWSTQPSPTVDSHKATPLTFSGSGEFEVELKGLLAKTKYFARAYARNSQEVGYSEEISFMTDAFDDAEIAKASITFYKLNSFEAKAAILTTGGADIDETGVCYNTEENPTIESTAVSGTVTVDDKMVCDVTDLELGQTYFVRPYIKTAKGVFYGPQEQIQTFNRGKITVNFHNQQNIPSDVYQRLKAMADHGVRLLEEHTSIVKKVTIEYNPGVATADASLSGWMRWGSNTSYQRTGTFLHEFSHTIGTGTSNYWTGTLIKNGLYVGTHANLALQKATNDPAAQLRGDALHWWPYGINGAHEDTGRESDYIITTLIIEGFKRDGIPIN